MLISRTLILMLFGILIVSCQIGGQNSPNNQEYLAFETIELEHQRNFYRAESPTIVVITNPEEAKNISGWVSPQTQAKVEKINFNQDFAVAVFQGSKPTSGYAIEVVGVSKSKNQINVQASVKLPERNTVQTQAFTSPYHFVKLEKTGMSGKRFVFSLMEGTEILAATQFRIP